MRTKRLCSCGQIVSDACPRCKSNRIVDREARKAYDHRHRRASECYRAKHPLCEACVIESGVVDASPSSDLHHIRKVKDFPDQRLDPNNWLALCKRHHYVLEDNATQAEYIKRQSQEVYFMMIDA